MSIPGEPVSDPQIMLRWSDDGGKTWSNWLTASIGKIGEFNKLIKFYRLGQSRNRVYHVRFTEAVKCNLMGARLEVSKGRF